MRVVFIQYGGDIQQATMMVASCKKLGYEVIQLSDMIAPMVPGVDRMERAPMHGGRMLFRARHLAEMEPPYVMLDTDMLVSRDISDGFNEDCDVSLTWRPKNMIWVKGEEKPIHMPYNGGVIFVRNKEFTTEVLKYMEKMEPKYKDWYGDQIALRDVAEGFRVHELRDERWNFVPDSVGHDLDNVRIYHFKGMRKTMMPVFYKRLYG